MRQMTRLDKINIVKLKTFRLKTFKIISLSFYIIRNHRSRLVSKTEKNINKH